MSIEALVEVSRYYGANSEYVIAGGGNTSFKDDAVLYIKGSGASLAEAAAENFVRMDRSALAAIWRKAYPADSEERESAVLADMMVARKPGEEKKRPSVETLLHDTLPFAYVVHTHPALVNGLTCARGGEAAAAELFAGKALWIPSTNPGYILSLAVKSAMDDHIARTGGPAPVILLQNHGVFVGADETAGIKAIYDNLIETIASKIKRKPDLSAAAPEPPGGVSGKIASLLAELAASGAAGMVPAGAGPAEAPAGRPTSFLRNNEIAALVRDRASFYPLSSAFTPDHIVYAGSDPLFVETGDPAERDPERIAAAVRHAWKEHTGKTGTAPKIAAVQGVGVFGIGPSEKAAALALELFTDALKVAVYTEAFGGPRFMSRDQIDFINTWEVERYRSNISGK
jgi:rhamnose utilization protein RhaD (predicted bifunctional aldolase and dehydrogenase)